MKRYLLFAWWTYYPSGGWGDFVGDFDSADEAAAEGERHLLGSGAAKDSFEVIDGTTGQAVRVSDSRR